MSFVGNNLYEFGEFKLDCSERTLRRESEIVPLAPKAMETLCLLVENHGRLMTKDELMNELWANTFVEEKNLAQNIFTLRKILGEDRNGRKFIETVPKRGYRFVAKVRPIESFREELVEVSLAQKTMIRAESEGDISSADLAEAVKETARSLRLDEKIEEKQLDRIEADEKSRKSFRIASAPVFAFSVLAILIAGFGFLFWQNYKFEKQKSAFASNADFTRLEFERLSDSGNVFFPTVSSDKQFIAYVVNENNKFSIVLEHLATKSKTTVVPPKDYEIRSPNFSLDGNYLYYAAADGKVEATVYQIPIFGGTPRQVAAAVSHNFTLSPDGTQIAFFRNQPEIFGNQLVIAQADGSGERVLATRQNEKYFRVWGGIPAWSPDGTKIVAVIINKFPSKYDNKNSYFVEIDAATGSEKELNAPDWNIAHQARWLSDGSGLIVKIQERKTSYFQLWYLAYPGGAAKPLTNDSNNYTEFYLAPDDSFVVATEEKTPYNLELIAADNPTEAQPLTDFVSAQLGLKGLDWTPDGKSLVYVQHEGLVAANLWKMNIETREAAQLTFDDGATLRFPRTTPDGKSVVFASNRTGEWHIWQIDLDGANLRQITDGESENCPQVSKDGKWLVYATPATIPDTLWKRPFAGGTPIKLLEHAGGMSNISPDMKQIVAHYQDPFEKEKDPWKYVLLPFEAGHKPKVLGFYGQYHVIRWKPDGSGIYFVSPGQSHTNIWFYNLAGEKIERITNFDSREISNIAVSPDGKQFAVARGKKTSNMIKIGKLKI